jgi:hypothetical protein
MVWHLATPFIGTRRRRWGTLGTEATDALPGDGLVPEPKWSSALGIAADAPPEAVWPWIAQIGQGRGGFYTYQTLENLAGCRITNTTEILPDHQHPTVGDNIYLHPDGPPLRIEIVDPPSALVPLRSTIGGPHVPPPVSTVPTLRTSTLRRWRFQRGRITGLPAGTVQDGSSNTAEDSTCPLHA